MGPLFGTNEQDVFTSANTLCSVRFYEDGNPSAASFYIELDFRCVMGSYGLSESCLAWCERLNVSRHAFRCCCCDSSKMCRMECSQSDCRSKGAPSAGATYAGTIIGFSDYISGATSTAKTYVTYNPTVLGGG